MEKRKMEKDAIQNQKVFVALTNIIHENKGRLEFTCGCVLWGAYYGATRPVLIDCGAYLGPECGVPEELAQAVEGLRVSRART